LTHDPAFNPNLTHKNAAFELENPNPFEPGRPMYRRIGSLGKRAARKGYSIARKHYYQLKSTNLRKKYDKIRQNRFDNSLLIYVIYNEGGRIDPYKLTFYQAIQRYAQKIKIVVNGSIEQEDYDLLATNADILVRENTGYDAAGFKAGVLSFSKEELQTFDRLLLVNDTNIGPVVNFDQVFQEMNPRQHDFWGLLYGREDIDPTGLNPFGYFPRHIQTYFFVVETSLLHSDEFYAFYENMPGTNSRNMAIARYETYLTKYFEDKGFRSSVYTNANEFADPYQYPLTLVRDFGFPIVKKAAIQYFDDKKMETIRGMGTISEVPALIDYFKEKDSIIYDYLQEALKEYQKK
jgi:lipopolysaccharide biosynthesis protein